MTLCLFQATDSITTPRRPLSCTMRLDPGTM